MHGSQEGREVGLYELPGIGDEEPGLPGGRIVVDQNGQGAPSCQENRRAAKRASKELPDAGPMYRERRQGGIHVGFHEDSGGIQFTTIGFEHILHQRAQICGLGPFRARSFTGLDGAIQGGQSLLGGTGHICGGAFESSLDQEGPLPGLPQAAGQFISRTEGLREHAHPAQAEGGTICEAVHPSAAGSGGPALSEDLPRKRHSGARHERIGHPPGAIEFHKKPGDLFLLVDRELHGSLLIVLQVAEQHRHEPQDLRGIADAFVGRFESHEDAFALE